MLDVNVNDSQAQTQEPQAQTKEPENKTTDQAAQGDTDVSSELLGLSKEELVSIIHDTRSEARTRRLKLREYEGKLSDIEKEKENQRIKSLEENKKWEELYKEKMESIKDYDELKSFKQSYLESCKEKVDSSIPKLTKAEQELFEISSKSMSYDDQIKFIDKMISGRARVNLVDNTQSTTRTNISDGQVPTAPFMKTNSVFNNVMTALAKGRVKQ